MTAISHEWVTVPVSDGSSIDVFLARPADAGDHHAAVIVLQEIWGVNGHIRDVCDRFARLGYTAAAPDIFHRSTLDVGQPRFEPPYTDRSGREHAAKLTSEGVEADLRATHDHLVKLLEPSTNDPRVAVCGFCMGGRLAFLANAILPTRCAVSFYGGGIASHPELAEKQNGPLMLFWGGRDGFITKEQRRSIADALEAANKRFTEINVGHADHGFFCNERPSYDAEAAREAWGMITAFFKTNLDG
ncbi:MAG: dienelactone hydrolase family protein [Sandaracinaceae bacterium]|nr:dienelactone hydrolase family protein [Sandaracinaceae bacterium]